jgi:aldose 1-epimerase
MARAAGAPPSGRQHVIGHAGQRLVVVQVGGGLREYQVDGFPVLDGYGQDQMASMGRGQVLAPWPNRLADGRYEVDGQTLQVPLSEPRERNAIHGLVRWSSWDNLATTGSRVRMGHVLWPQPGYPFTLELELEYELSDTGLRVTMHAENIGLRPAPYGAGMHPYVRAELGGIDTSVLRLPAETRFEMDERHIPTGRRLSVAGTPYDFREPRAIGGTAMDAAFTDLARDADGLAWTELRSGADARRTSVWVDEHFGHLMIFTGSRRSLAVEPSTCAPDAFHNGQGLILLQPGERVAGSWGISVSR